MMGENYSYSADIWSLGLVIYELTSGIFPYEANTTLLLIDKILNEPEPVLPDNGRYSLELIDFIKRCLKKDPEKRDSITQLCVKNKII